MKISELGEFGLIERIASFLPAARSSVVVGIGDDVAVLQVRHGNYLLATCDIQVENVHFLAGKITPYQLGRKIVAINVSDIAAMGGSPDWALVSLALPKHQQVDFVDDLYRGMQEQIDAAGAAIVGGNISEVPKDVVVDFFLLGNVAPQHLIRRNGAKQGDLIMVTGTLGDSRAGLELVRVQHLLVSDNARRQASQRHLTPRPRLLEGQVLGRCGNVHAMADVSDGLLGDLGHICGASGVGAEIWAEDIPVGNACLEVAAASGKDGQEWAMTGGEDYELLFAAAPHAVQEIAAMLLNETGTSSRVIGRVVSAKDGIRVLLADGRDATRNFQRSGWDHFTANARDAQDLLTQNEP